MRTLLAAFVLTILALNTSIRTESKAQQNDGFHLAAEYGQGTVLKAVPNASQTVTTVLSQHGVWLYDMSITEGFRPQSDQPIVSFSNRERLATTAQVMQWSPDDNLLAIATQDNLSVFDMGQQKIVTNIPISVVAPMVRWSYDSELLALITDDTTIMIVNVLDQTTYEFALHNRRVTDLEWHPDEFWLASASADSVAMTKWTGTSWESADIAASDLGISRIDWSPDGSALAGINGQESGFVWQRDGSDMNFAYEFSTIGVRNNQDVRWSREPHRLAILMGNGDVQIWNASSGERDVTLPTQSPYASYYGLWWLNDTQLLVSDGQISLRSLTDQQPFDYDYIATQFDDPIRIPDVQVNADVGQLLITHRGIVYWFDIFTGDLIARILDFPAPSINLAWSPDGETLLGFSEFGTIEVWNVTDGSYQKIDVGAENYYPNDPVMGLDATWSTLALFASYSDDAVHIYDAAEMLSSTAGSIPIQSLRIESSIRENVESLMLSSAGDVLIVRTQGENTSIFQYMADEWELAYSLEGTRFDTITSTPRLHPVDNLLAISFDDIVEETWGVQVWNIDTQAVVATLLLDENVYDLAWKPDGNAIAIATHNAVQIWNLTTNTVDMSLPLAAPDTFNKLKWDRYLTVFAPYWQNQIALWDVSGAEPDFIQAITVPHGAGDVVWSPNGFSFATAGADGIVRIWTDAEVPAAPTNLQVDQRIAPLAGYIYLGHLAGLGPPTSLFICEEENGCQKP